MLFVYTPFYFGFQKKVKKPGGFVIFKWLVGPETEINLYSLRSNSYSTYLKVELKWRNPQTHNHLTLPTMLYNLHHPVGKLSGFSVLG